MLFATGKLVRNDDLVIDVSPELASAAEELGLPAGKCETYLFDLEVSEQPLYGIIRDDGNIYWAEDMGIADKSLGAPTIEAAIEICQRQKLT